MTRYVALLRAINVGGSNIIKMADLRASFEAMGFDEVATLIQSGNVLFSSKSGAKARLAATIEKSLEQRFGYVARIVLLAAEDLARVVAQAPDQFGRHTDRYRFDVLFVRAPMTAADVLPQLSVHPEVDDVHAGQHALYFRRLIARVTMSRLPKLIQLPVYKDITIRNWNTTTKLLAMVSPK